MITSISKGKHYEIGGELMEAVRSYLNEKDFSGVVSISKIEENLPKAYIVERFFLGEVIEL